MYCKILLIGLCVFVSVNKISSAQVNQSNDSRGQGNKNNESTDYNYDDYDEPNSDNKSNEASNIVDDATRTQLLTKDHRVVAKIDDEVKIDCVVENPQTNTIIIWYKDTSVLYTATTKISSDDRISLNENNTLIINRARVEDDSIYKCSVLPEKLETKIELKILSPVKSIRIERDSENVTNGEIEVDRHFVKKIILNCIAEGGFPEPAIKWSKNGFPIEQHIKDKEEITIESGSLIINNIKKHHKGEYQCLVENGIGIDHPLTASVNLIVKFKPAIVKHHDYINTGEGYDADIECQYDSNPKAKKIIWSSDNNKEIRNNEKYSINNDMLEHHNHTRTRLTIKNINKDDLVTYICKIHNDLGETVGKTSLGLVPEPAKLESHHYEKGVLQTSWLITSIQPLTEMQVLYRPNNNTKFLEVKAVITENNKFKEAQWRIKCDIKIPDGEWTITSRAKNTEGWAKTDSNLYKIIQISTNSANSFSINIVILVLLYTISRLL